MPDRSNNALVNPSFASNPPVKLNVNARILGLVIGILAAIGLLLSLFAGGLLSIFGFVGGLSPIWLLGILVAIAAEVLAALGGFQMYNLNARGKELVIYGLALGLVGAVLTLVGEIIAYSGYTYLYSSGGAIVGLIVDIIIYGCIYYLVVISRFPSQPPLVGSGFGGPPTPPYGGPPQQYPPQQYPPQQYPPQQYPPQHPPRSSIRPSSTRRRDRRRALRDDQGGRAPHSSPPPRGHQFAPAVSVLHAQGMSGVLRAAPGRPMASTRMIPPRPSTRAASSSMTWVAAAWASIPEAISSTARRQPRMRMKASPCPVAQAAPGESA